MRASAPPLVEGFDLLDVGAAMFDDRFRLVHCNAAFRRLRNYPEDVCRDGVTLETLLRFNAARGDFGEGDIGALVAERIAEIDKSAERSIERTMADGQILAIRYRRTPSGGLLVTFDDRTAERKAEAALAASEARYALAAEIANEIVYDWDIAGDTLHLSEKFAPIPNFDPKKDGPKGWFNLIHSDDRDGYVAATRAHLKGETAIREIEYRAEFKPGKYVWIHDRSKGVRQADGRMTRVVGAIRDVTDIKEAKEALDRTEARLMSSLATISDGILLVDSDNCVQLWNDRYYEIFTAAAGGADLSEVIVKGRPFFDMIFDGYNTGMFKPHPDGAEAWRAARMKAWEKPASQWELELSNGMWLLLNERRTPEGGRVSVYTDITELKRREQEAQAATVRFEDAIESISTGFALFDQDDRLMIWNSRFREYFEKMADLFVPGVKFRDLLSASIERGMFPSAEGEGAAFLDRIMEQRLKGDGKVRENRLSGGLWLQIRDHRTRDGGLVSIYTDVTELKSREQEAQAARERFEEAIEAISTGFVLWDADDRLVICNSRYLNYFPEMPDIVVPGARFIDIVRIGVERGIFPEEDDDGEVYLETVQKTRLRGDGASRERLLANGTWLQITDHRTKDGGIVSIYADVTELKQSEEEMRRQSQILEATLENMGQGITMMDADLQILTFNSKFLDLMDFPEDLFVRGFSLESAFRFNAERGEYGPGDVEEQVRERMELSRKFLPHRFERNRPDGLTLEIVGNPLAEGGLVTTYTDITERKQAEAALEAALEEFNVVVETINYGVLIVGPDLRARLWNPAFLKYWSLSPPVLESKPHLRELIERLNSQNGIYGVPPEEWDAWLDNRIATVAAGDIPPTEVRRADGSVMSYQCVALPDGGRMLTYFDITELKEREAEISHARDAAEAALENLRKAQERLVQAEKMASLGQLTAGIAHEIKNPLNFVNNFARLSDEMLGELAELLKAPIAALDADARDDAEDLLATVRGNLGKINEHGRRADSIVKNMLLHSREGPSEKQSVALNGVAAEALNLAYHGARAENPKFNIEMKTDFDEAVGEIECFPQDMMRVFLNLITNGMYAANKRRLTAGDGFAPEISVSTKRDGELVAIEVRDNGSGIEPEARERIFLPFFTTKPAGEGTGLGLSLSFDIVVKQHGGELTVESEPDNFTAFRVTLPRTPPAPKGDGR